MSPIPFESPGAGSIVVIGAHEIEVNTLLAAFDEIGHRSVLGCCTLGDAARLLASGEHDVFVFLAPTASMAKRWHLSMLQSAECAALPDLPDHETILLCARSDDADAHPMVRKSAFDDFVDVEPEIDRMGLDLAVRRAQRMSETNERIAAKRRTLHEYRQTAHLACDEIGSEESRVQLAREQATAQETTRQAVSSRIDEFRASIVDGGFADAVQAVDPERLEERLRNLDGDAIAAEFVCLQESLASSLDGWLDGVGDRIEAQCTSADEMFASERKRILVVDDDEDVAQVVARMIVEDGYEPILVGDEPHHALLRAKKLRPDLILMDFKMSIMDGLDLTHMVKKRVELSSIPIITVTGYATSELVRDGIDAGAVDFVTKPIRREALSDKIRRALLGEAGTGTGPAARVQASAA